jgi:hypothetical protein
MSETSTQTMNATFLEVVEKLTFMFGEETGLDEIERDGEPWVEARMHFTGDLCGSLSVIVPQSLQPEIAANILGLDADGIDTQAVLDDALREMLNVVCGHVIMAINGSDTNFDLQAPSNEVLSEEELEAIWVDPGTSGFLLDDEPVLLNLKTE